MRRGDVVYLRCRVRQAPGRGLWPQLVVIDRKGRPVDDLRVRARDNPLQQPGTVLCCPIEVVVPAKPAPSPKRKDAP